MLLQFHRQYVKEHVRWICVLSDERFRNYSCLGLKGPSIVRFYGIYAFILNSHGSDFFKTSNEVYLLKQAVASKKLDRKKSNDFFPDLNFWI